METKPFVQWINEDEAEGQAREVYDEYMLRMRRDFVPDVIKCFSQRPDFMKQVLEFSNTVHFSNGHLNRRQKEMIATFVSGINRCHY